MSKTRSEQHDNRTYRTSVVLGAMALVVGLLASAVLSVDALGLIPALPGCGAQSACDRLTGGVWGRIPLLDVPVSFVGFAYFLAMLVLWFRERSTRALRVVMRLAAVYSLFSIGLMAVLGLWCPWCLAAQGANLVYWFCTGVRSRGSVRPRTGRVVGVLAMSVVVLVLLMVVRQLGRAERAIEAERALAESLQRIAEAEADRERLALLEGRHVIGAAEPAVELVMFTDYQCPDCRRIERQVAAILESQPDVAVVIKHFPFKVLAKDGDIVVLGGLVKDDVQDSQQGVPLLSDIPLFGRLFRSDVVSVTKSNLLVFIRSTIIRDDADLAGATAEKYRYIRDQQMERRERGLMFLDDGNLPVLPTWEEQIQQLPEVPESATGEG